MESSYYLCPHCHTISYQSSGCPHCRSRTTSIIPERLNIERIIPVQKRVSVTKVTPIQKRKTIIPKVVKKKIGYSRNRKFVKRPSNLIRKNYIRMENKNDVENVLVDKIVNFVFGANNSSK
jgi:hypothetical protein